MIQHYVLTRLKSGLYCFSFSVADELAFYFSFAQCIVLISHNLIVFVVFFLLVGHCIVLLIRLIY